MCCRLEESKRTNDNTFGQLCDIAFAVYRVLPTSPTDPNTENTAENLLEAVAHSSTYCYIFVTADCILEKGSYSIVPLSFNQCYPNSEFSFLH